MLFLMKNMDIANANVERLYGLVKNISTKWVWIWEKHCGKKKLDNKDKLVAQVCKKWTKACPEKRESRLLIPDGYTRKTEKDREV